MAAAAAVAGGFVDIRDFLVGRPIRRRGAMMTSLGTKSLAQQQFGAAAADYATSAVHARGESLARLVELVAPEKRWRVLDVATGAGHTALALAPHVAKVTASDITEAMLAEAKKLAAARGLGNVKTVPAKAEDLPFPDMSFDLVTCRLAAHHFGDVAAFAAEAYRVLMPNGLLAVVDKISPDQHIFPTLSAEEHDTGPKPITPSRSCATRATVTASASPRGATSSARPASTSPPPSTWTRISNSGLG